MNVANLCFSTAWGGLEMSSVKMTRLFHQAGHRSIEICQPDTPIHKALLEQGLQARTVTAGKYFPPPATRFIRQQLIDQQIEALFLHSIRDIWIARPALIGLPHIRFFGFARMFFKNISKKDLLHAWLYRRLDRMIALSHIQKGFLADCLPVDKFEIIPNGVDTERFQPRPRRDDIRKSWGVRPENFLFGLIGRLDRQKGSLEFVQAAAEILKTHPQARFALVGGNTIGEGDFDREIRALLTSHGLGTQVVLTEFRKDIPDVMNALDVFVMPSYEENFANVLLEALASGLPVIGTDSGGTPEILDRGETGLLCAPQSFASLAEAMRRLLDDPELTQVLRRRARAKAEREYDMRKVFARIETLAQGKFA